MPQIENLKIGQTLYTVMNVRMGNTTMRRRAVHDVRVTEIAKDYSYVMASWNSNKPQKYYRYQVKRWKVNRPKE